MKNEDEVAARLGRNVKAARNARDWSQEQLATQLTRALGREMKPLTVLRIEKGTRPTSVLELVTLAHVFGTTIGELVGEGEEDSRLLPAVTRAAFARSGYLEAAEALWKAYQELGTLDFTSATERTRHECAEMVSELDSLLDATGRETAEHQLFIADTMQLGGEQKGGSEDA